MTQKIEDIKDPSLKLRYAKGLGDIVAAILHSKALNWLTKLITGQDRPCNRCSARAHALNVLFPIPVWKLFFKYPEDMIDSLERDYKKDPTFVVNKTQDGLGLNASKSIIDVIQTPPNHADDNMLLLSTSETTSGEFVIRIQIFKHK
jgi:hypothetical protein